MNRTPLLFIGGIILALLVLAGVLFAFVGTKKPADTQPSSTVTFPAGGVATGTASTSTPGSAAGSPSFLSNPDVTEDSENPGLYYLGNDPVSQENPQYIIEYIASSQSFIVSLTQEPIGETRHAAETYLQGVLGLTQEQMCSLKYIVNVPGSVNEQYSSVNLGFSFCSGAVRLPG